MAECYQELEGKNLCKLVNMIKPVGYMEHAQNRWIVTDQIRGIPFELDEAARLEGASQFTIMTRICLPLAMPGVAVSAIFSFIFSWNELMFGLILTRNDAKTAPAMAVSFMEGYNLPYGKIMATSTLIVIPVLIFALLASRHLVRGLTMGAVK